jgi:hypothetical protein
MAASPNARVLTAALGLSFGAVAATASGAHAGALTIRISFDQVFDRISPSAKLTTTHKDILAQVNENGEIHSTTNSASARHSRSRDAELKLGPEEKGEEWRVVGKDKLMFVSRYPSFHRAILLTVSAKTCVAQVEYQLDPGSSDYRYHRLKDGGLAIARSASAQNLTCSVVSP